MFLLGELTLFMNLMHESIAKESMAVANLYDRSHSPNILFYSLSYFSLRIMGSGTM